LQEEIIAWQELEWDFSASAELVRRFVGQRALTGYALRSGQHVVGYTYAVNDDHKGLIGDLYVMRAWRGPGSEDALLAATVDSLIRTPFLSRIETQLVLAADNPSRPLPALHYAQRFERQLMVVDLLESGTPPPRGVRGPVLVEPWTDLHIEATAHLIPAAYAGHTDSLINDQYRSVAGARRFLHNIVQFPGCGAFFRPGSFVARDTVSGEVCGISLTSIVAPEIGHITQICVSPAMRGLGLGYDLLRLSLDGLFAAGCRKTSLTVTSSNHEAVRLYERTGFSILRKFFAYVWEGFGK
jgi:ribosomal protein S18 acetylase RimI-like enzyme